MNPGARKISRIVILLFFTVTIAYVFFGMQRKKQVDIFHALQDHHGIIRELMETSRDDRSVFPELKRHLEFHHRSEDNILYDFFSTREIVRKESMTAVEEHHIIDTLLRAVDDVPAGDERWSIRFEMMQEYTEHHLVEEEEEIFPKLRRITNRREIFDMGRRFREEQQKEGVWD